MRLYGRTIYYLEDFRNWRQVKMDFWQVLNYQRSKSDSEIILKTGD